MSTNERIRVLKGWNAKVVEVPIEGIEIVWGVPGVNGNAKA